jgi:electron transfer flavoprotein alpha subunit
VVALTMGPASAAAVLEETVERGADRAVHLVDQRFSGADTLATARALARAIEREEADVVLLGRSTLDGATAQVAPQVAELLGRPQGTHVTAISVEDGRLRLERETERGAETWTTPLPVVVSVERGPDPPEREGEGEAEIEELSAEDLGGTPREYGTRGSPTFVQQVRTLSLEREVEKVHDAEAGAEKLEELLSGLERQTSDEGWRQGDGERSRSIWVLAERDGQGLHPTSLEGIACAREAADDIDADVGAVLLCAEPGELAEELAAHGADRVLVVRDEALREYATAPFAGALCAAVEEHGPYAVIAPWTAQGRDYVPRAAARLGLGLTGDFVRLEVAAPDDEEHEPDLLWIKPAWAGTVESPIIAHRAPSVGTLRPGAFRPLERDEDANCPVDEFEPDLDGDGQAECEDRRVEIEDERLLDNSPVVVCVGEKLDENQVGLARELAGAMEGAVGATERAVEAGLAPRQLEIAVVRRSMSPLLVLTLGVGEAEELDAVRGARRVVTVHPDEDAPAHNRADLAIVAEPEALASAALERIGGREAAVE